MGHVLFTGQFVKRGTVDRAPILLDAQGNQATNIFRIEHGKIGTQCPLLLEHLQQCLGFQGFMLHGWTFLGSFFQ